jgi:3-oxoacyl-[acyl-carrier protein] reductase
MNIIKKKALVLAGSRGIGKAIANALEEVPFFDVDALSSQQLDTSDLDACMDLCNHYKSLDVLVLNTGGPPAKNFTDISLGDWNKYHNQLFLGFALILQNIKINDGGFVFLISSYNIKEPDVKLVLSNTYRIASASLLKSLAPSFAEREVSCVNIAPGPMDTDRFNELNSDPIAVGKSFPMKRVGRPKEIGDFVAAIVSKDISYLSGVTINFDGAISKGVL